MDEAGATVMTVDCYASMGRTVPAYPCIGSGRSTQDGRRAVGEVRRRQAHELLLQL